MVAEFSETSAHAHLKLPWVAKHLMERTSNPSIEPNLYIGFLNDHVVSPLSGSVSKHLCCLAEESLI